MYFLFFSLTLSIILSLVSGNWRGALTLLAMLTGIYLAISYAAHTIASMVLESSWPTAS